MNQFNYPQPEEEHHEDDLQAFLGTAKRFWQKFGQSLLTTILIVLVVVMGGRYWADRHQRARNAAYSALENAFTPQAKAALADGHRGVPHFASRAKLAAADQLYQQQMYPIDQAALVEPDKNTPVMPKVPTEFKTDDLEQAAKLYRQVIELNAADQPEASALMRAHAQIGLATILEMLKQYDQAAKIYQQAAAEKDHPWPNYQAILVERGENLDRIQQPIKFPPAPPKPPATKGSILDVGGAGSGTPSGLTLPSDLITDPIAPVSPIAPVAPAPVAPKAPVAPVVPAAPPETPAK